MCKNIFGISKIIAIAGICVACVSTNASKSLVYGLNKFKNAFHKSISERMILNEDV